MNDTDLTAASGKTQAAAAATTLDQGQRMQQRQEWERAFLDAQRRQPVAIDRPDAARQPGARTRVAPGAEMRDTAKVPAAAGTENKDAAKGGVAQPSAPGASSAPATDGPRPVAMLPAPGAAIATVAPPGPSPSPRAGPIARAAPPVPASHGQVPDAAAVHVHEQDGAVRIAVRDATFRAADTRSLVARVRGLLNRLGLRLAALTLNGERLVDAAPPRAAVQSDSEKTSDLDLTI